MTDNNNNNDNNNDAEYTIAEYNNHNNNNNNNDAEYTVAEEDWSPFYCLPKAKLTPSGLIELDTSDNEVLLLRRSNIEFRHEGPTPMAPRPKSLKSTSIWKNRTASHSLVLTITTHRFILLYKSNNNNTVVFVHLSNIKETTLEGKGGPSFMSPNSTYKIVFLTQTYDELLLVFRASSSSQCRDDRDAALVELKKAVSRKQWEVATRLEEKKMKQQHRYDKKTNKKVGLGRLMEKNKLRHQQNAQLANSAVSGDSNQLLQEATELIKVIQKYTIVIQKYDTKNSKTNNKDNEVAANKLKGLLSDMGMTSALTQSQMSGGGSGGSSSSGSGTKMFWKSDSNNNVDQEYHEVTARQVADFLVPKLHNAVQQGGSGMMSLTDVYCLFNRARGTNLISPEDLREACNLLDNLHIGLNQRIFPSGVTVLQLTNLSLSNTNKSDDTMKQKIIQLCPCTALEASHKLQLSPLLTVEQLEEAERLGWLCRDICLSSSSATLGSTI
eukprot:CAMPEP_0170800832 /NCGR_PEP_ID=MMETSP0733-20121128/28114_1 /TAXON_ID=186038 /ORGANISM="Fragilariopsis kerguelensis, Strain L26-C5" /LENGTH=496 /DNA_ID=CAMNT_0011153307 /DNA_START=146 /DNA_END=1633 /DNA_ORIENTATION=-